MGNRDNKAAENHVITGLCLDSRWPFTDRLTQQQIVCMRDSYCGRRFKPTALEQRSTYDRIHLPEEGWDQRIRIGSRNFLKPLQISARDEERHRKTAVCANSTYGHLAENFYDFQSKDNRKICCTQHFCSKKDIGLPPLVQRK